MFTGRPVVASGDEQVGLATEEGRDLQHIDDCADLRALVRQVHVGEDGEAALLAHARELGESLLDTRAARRTGIGPVGLVEGRLEDDPPGDERCEAGERVGNAQVERVVLEHAGARDQEEAVRRKAGVHAQSAASTSVSVGRGAHRLAPARDRGGDEGGEERVRARGARLQLGVELTADEPRMLRQLDDLDERSIGGESAQAHPVLDEAFAIGVGDFIAVAMALADLRYAVDVGGLGAAGEAAGIRP